MCDPATIIAGATLALGVGSTVSSYMGQRQQITVDRQVSNLNFAQQSNIISQKKIQLDQGKSEDAFDTAIATVRAQGAVAAGAANQGLSGASIIQAVNADMFGIGRQVEAQNINDENQRIQLANELAGADLTRRSEIASKKKPGALDLALGIGGDVLKGVSAYTTAGGKFK